MKGYLAGTRFFYIAARLAALAIFFMGSFGNASAKETLASPGATVEYSNSPDALIVSYTLHLGELAESDRGPSMQIYGDGLANIHYPAYMARAGSYSIRLSGDEMNKLIHALVADGLLKFDSAKARATARDIGTLRRESQGVMHYVSDASTSVIELHLVRYASPGTPSLQAANVDKTIRWSGLQSDARIYPDHVAIQKLATAERRLRTLMERPDLVKVDSRNRAASSTPGKD